MKVKYLATLLCLSVLLAGCGSKDPVVPATTVTTDKSTDNAIVLETTMSGTDGSFTTTLPTTYSVEELNDSSRDLLFRVKSANGDVFSAYQTTADDIATFVINPLYVNMIQQIGEAYPDDEAGQEAVLAFMQYLFPEPEFTDMPNVINGDPQLQIMRSVNRVCYSIINESFTDCYTPDVTYLCQLPNGNYLVFIASTTDNVEFPDAVQNVDNMSVEELTSLTTQLSDTTYQLINQLQTGLNNICGNIVYSCDFTE